MADQWFKFYGGEYLADPKMLALNSAERSCWVTLLCYASMSDEDGRVKYLTEERLMLQSGIEIGHPEWKKTIGVLVKFEKLEMIHIDAGSILVQNWKNRQERYMTNAERQARFRAKSKERNAEVTPMSHNSNARIEENRIDKNKIHDQFEQFWLVYPRKITKKKAFDVWKRITPDDALFAQILAAIEVQKKSDQWTKDEGKFIPHATTWLNGERWNDELRTGKSTASGKYSKVKVTEI